MHAKNLFIRLSMVLLMTVLLAIPLGASVSANTPALSNVYSAALDAGNAVSAKGISTAPAACSCQCVTYIKNRYGLTGAIGGSGGAKDMGPYLAARGFRQVSSPRVGAVVIFQTAFFSSWPGNQYGHVGVIESVRSVENNSKWSITVRGANQVGSTFTEYNCTNVSVVGYKSYPKNSTIVSYWVR